MPKIHINGSEHYYEQTGEGFSLVFIHGAFGDTREWDPQWNYFASNYRLLRYDLRGHGRTGASDLDRYTMETYSDDLTCILDELKIDRAVICGHSWGGGIAQVFAVNNPGRLKGLVLAGSTAAMSVTTSEKLLRYVLFPRPAMMLAIRSMSVEQFVRFSFWLAGLTLGKNWLNKDENTLELVRQSMLQVEHSEYLKIWGAIYGFDLQPLDRITCPTMVINGERDTKMVFRHTAEILRRIPQAESHVIPAAYHIMTLEQPEAFNEVLAHFLHQVA
jgi:pimeloyl-ACP methyl ester carboxylesterase